MVSVQKKWRGIIWIRHLYQYILHISWDDDDDDDSPSHSVSSPHLFYPVALMFLVDKNFHNKFFSHLLYLFIARRIKLHNIYLIIILHCGERGKNMIGNIIGIDCDNCIRMIDADFLIYQAGVDNDGNGGRNTAYFNRMVMKCISIAKSACKHVNARE